MKTIDELIKELKDNVEYEENNAQNMDEISWSYQLGILISGNDAKLILEHLTKQHGK